MKPQLKPITIFAFSIIAIAIVASSCKRTENNQSKEDVSSVDSRKQEQAEVYIDTPNHIEEKTPEYKPDLADSAQQERIALLRTMLSELDDAEDSDITSNPHAERLQDPEAIKEAILQLKEGKDICTRCLMACGAAM